MTGGIYRRQTYPVAGHTDDPDDVWAEFQRIRSHFMRLDQNNVRTAGITRARIATPGDSGHIGLSDYRPSTGTGIVDNAIMYAANSSTDTYARASSDGTWSADSHVEIEGVSRSSAIWIVSGSAQFNSAAANYASVEVRVFSGSTGPSSASGAARLSATNGHASIMVTSALLIPAGDFKLQLLVRVSWREALVADVTVTRRSLMAYGLYR